MTLQPKKKKNLYWQDSGCLQRPATHWDPIFAEVYGSPVITGILFVICNESFFVELAGGLDVVPLYSWWTYKRERKHWCGPDKDKEWALASENNPLATRGLSGEEKLCWWSETSKGPGMNIRDPQHFPILLGISSGLWREGPLMWSSLAQVKLAYRKLHLHRMMFNLIFYFQCNPRGGSAGRAAFYLPQNFSKESWPRPLTPKHTCSMACSNMRMHLVAKWPKTVVIGRSFLCRWS